MNEDEHRLRYLLWMHHGCASPCLYGDDGEMQCSSREHGFGGIDFLRDSPDLLQWKLSGIEYKKLVARPTS
jgi:hypothetical protein